MSEPVHELSREVRNILERVADAGGSVSINSLREELPLSHDEAFSILDQLREVGIAVEVAPGEWAPQEAQPAPGPVRVSVPDEPEPPGVAEMARLLEGTRPMLPQPRPASSVRLTAAMVDALDDEALGKLVRAGVQGSDGVFALEVE